MTNIGIDDKNRDQVGKILNRVLADEYVRYTKTRGYHWHVVGPQFNDLHKFFEGQYEELADIVDDVAERGRSIGVSALGSLQEMLDEKSLEEDTTKGTDSKHMLRSLLSDHEAVIRKLRVDLAQRRTSRRRDAAGIDCRVENERDSGRIRPDRLIDVALRRLA